MSSRFASFGRLVIFCTLLTAACSSGDGPHSEVARAGVETLIDGPSGVEVTVPATALDVDARITVTSLPASRRPANAVSVAPGIRLLPEGQTFKTGVLLQIPISPASLPAGRTIDDVVIMRSPQAGDAFVPLPTRRVGNAVVAQTEHFSDFVAVVAMDMATIPCVDHYCPGSETCATCPIDCGLCLGANVCGNGLCESTESCGTCPADCSCLSDGGVSTTAVVFRADTNLEWIRDTDFGPYTQAGAAAACDNLVANGIPDWRLATRAELVSIMDYTKGNPAYDGTIFPILAGTTVWTATADAQQPTTNAWAVFTSGDITSESNILMHAAHCVRSVGSAPTRTLVDNLDGTVTDTRSGLIWHQTNAISSASYASAVTTCNASTLGAMLWRVPTAAELLTLVDDTISTGATIDSTAFPSTMAVPHWTSTVEAALMKAWVVDFANASVAEIDQAQTATVRCVH